LADHGDGAKSRYVGLADLSAASKKAGMSAMSGMSAMTDLAGGLERTALLDF
jgi:hypothetical protein